MRTWATVTCLAVGGHAGIATHVLWFSDTDQARGSQSATQTGPNDPATPAVWCTDSAHCFIDVVALAAEPMPFPRGLRLEPRGGGLRLDGVRGIVTRMGLRNGDILLAVDDQPLRDGGDLGAIETGIAAGGFVLRYRRADEEHTKRITLLPTRTAIL